MRVISGVAKGRKLKTLEDYSIRPTTDRVKEAIFSAIQFEIPGARILDLFAGSGGLGIEALSRGASEAVFVDESEVSLSVAKENLLSCNLADKAVMVHKPFDTFIKNYTGKPFDIAFMDPPYRKKLVIDAISLIDTCDIMSQYGIIICENSSFENVSDRIGNYFVRKNYRYGKTIVTIYNRKQQK